MVFPEGIGFAEPRDSAPDFIKGRVWIRVAEFIDWLSGGAGVEHTNNGYINLDLKEARSGKMYLSVDTWKPKCDGAEEYKEGAEKQTDDDDLPF
jgi:hypothetical protein